MTDNQKMYFIQRIRELQANDQLVLCEILLEELTKNNYYHDPNYNVNKSNILISMLKERINKMGNSSERNSALATIKKYDELDAVRQNKINKYLLTLILNETYGQLNGDVCEEDTHEFMEWQHDMWVNEKNLYFDHQVAKFISTKFENWTRVCSLCDYEEVRNSKPKE